VSSTLLPQLLVATGGAGGMLIQALDRPGGAQQSTSLRAALGKLLLLLSMLAVCRQLVSLEGIDAAAVPGATGCPRAAACRKGSTIGCWPPLLLLPEVHERLLDLQLSCIQCLHSQRQGIHQLPAAAVIGQGPPYSSLAAQTAAAAAAAAGI
jgi:hypothetical protein